MNLITTVAIVDDHPVFRAGLQFFFEKYFDDLQVKFEVNNGQELQEKLMCCEPPDVLLLDIRMPVMNGWETLEWLQKHHPQVSVIVLTMCDTEFTLGRLIQMGARGVLNKNVDPHEIRKAILQGKELGYYFSNPFTRNLMLRVYDRGIKKPDPATNLTQEEWEFLQLSATELPYKSIADKLQITKRRADKIRDGLFEKLRAQSRVTLAVAASRHGIDGTHDTCRGQKSQKSQMGQMSQMSQMGH